MKTKIFISALMACAVAMTSCSDFLTEDPKGQMVPENYFTSQNDLDGAINVLYAQVQYSINGTHTLSPNWMGDDLTALTSGNKDVYREFDSYKVNDNNADSKSAWNTNYAIIKAANFIINNVEKVPISEEEANIGKGQALFWRAVAYFKLVRWYGEIPLILTTDLDFNVKKSTIAQIYAQICSDLEEAERILPYAYTSSPRVADGLNNYINKGAAQAVLAAVYMARAGYPLNEASYYSKAAQMAKAVIDGVASNNYYYKLEPNYKDRFMYVSNPYSQEGVVAIKFNKDNPWGWSGLDSWNSVCQAYESVTNGGWGDAVGEIKYWKEMPEGPRKDAIYGSDGGKILVEKNAYKDQLIDWYQKDNNGAFILNECHPMFRTLLYGGGTDGSAMKDYNDREYTMNNGICSQTLYLVSYSEVLLWYAEAQARSGSVNEEAKQCLQKVLDRAYGEGVDKAENYSNDPTTFANKCLKEHGYEVRDIM
ncbi:RagB/SusD family nutrient uptake outer membrane protein [Bacteroides mediterraneensis]|uniref:RagB/SusD family nutrient uptake outer membrane protein n=1 Tax=Bacteroides mediterraneensis TaxID=1841856 RepID=UPI00195F2413|nr:RagB/SusD family nutrient uptake outer membrane protein [Bacteroides mediterraneensis]MBM6780279.1 RagB/SusD family nutrient uptake outer membrane protein [Bacteroides mediterraneensis]